jgi:hypothetical protein
MNKLDHKYGVDEDRDEYTPDDTYYSKPESEK